MLTVIDEFTIEYLSINASRWLTSECVLERLSDLFFHGDPPECIRADNGPEFTAHRLRDWLGNVCVQTLFIAPGFVNGGRPFFTARRKRRSQFGLRAAFFDVFVIQN